jgi:hypothetical protein
MTMFGISENPNTLMNAIPLYKFDGNDFGMSAARNALSEWLHIIVRTIRKS